MENKKKQNILYKELDVVFVYLFLFLVGIAIVLGMTSYINGKVKEFNQESIKVVSNN